MKTTRRQQHVYRTLYRNAVYWTQQLTKEQNANNGKGSPETAITANKWRGMFAEAYYKSLDNK